MTTTSEIPTGAKVALWVLGLFVLVMVMLWLAPFTSVDAGHRGVVLRGGKLVRVLDEGYQYKTPVIESVQQVDTRTQVEKVKASAASKDLQTVSTEVAVNYNVLPDRVAEMWNTVGKNYKMVVIDPAIQEAVKAATAKHTAEELITKRESVKDEITMALQKRLAEAGFLKLTQVSITDFDFSTSFNAAIETKVTAEQNALAQKNKLEQVKYEAQQTVEKARAEAEAIKIQASAIQQQGGADYVKLQAISKWNGQLPVNLYGSAPVPFISIGN